MKAFIPHPLLFIMAILILTVTPCLVLLIFYPFVSIVVFASIAVLVKFFVKPQHLIFFEEEYAPDVPASELRKVKKTYNFFRRAA